MNYRRMQRPRETRRPRTPACSCGMRVLISFTLLYVVSPFIVEDTAHAMIDTLWECHSRACDVSAIYAPDACVYLSGPAELGGSLSVCGTNTIKELLAWDDGGARQPLRAIIAIDNSSFMVSEYYADYGMCNNVTRSINKDGLVVEELNVLTFCETTSLNEAPHRVSPLNSSTHLRWFQWLPRWTCIVTHEGVRCLPDDAGYQWKEPPASSDSATRSVCLILFFIIVSTLALHLQELVCPPMWVDSLVPRKLRSALLIWSTVITCGSLTGFV